MKRKRVSQGGKVFLSFLQCSILPWEVRRSESNSKFQQVKEFSTKDFNLL